MATIKTIRLRKNPAEEAVSPVPESAGKPAAAPAPQAAPLGLEPVGAAPAAGGGSYTWFAILGIIATLAMLAVIGLQYAEISYFKASPSVWPQ